MDFVALFPSELAEEIFSYLPARDLSTCAAVSKSWREATNSSRLWKKCVEEDCLPISETTNLDDEIGSREMEARSSSEVLTPVNVFKAHYFHNERLNHNWTYGVYKTHFRTWKQLPAIKLPLTVIYPSQHPSDCCYYPYLGSDGSSNVYNLFLMRVDAQPEIVCTLLETIQPKDIIVACVMRDYVVWINKEDVQCIALTQPLDNPQIQKIGTLEYKEWSSTYLSMDRNNIIAMRKYSLKVWSKKNFEIKFVHNSQPGNVLKCCCLYNNFLIFSYFDQISSYIQVYKDSMLLYPEIVLDNYEILETRCNEQIITYLMIPLQRSSRYYLFQVRDTKSNEILFRDKIKETFTSSFLEYYPYRHTILDKFILVVEDTFLTVIHPCSNVWPPVWLKVNHGAINYTVRRNPPIKCILGHIVVCSSFDEAGIEVWDLKKGFKLYTLEYREGLQEILFVSENRVLAMCRDGYTVGSMKVFDFSSD